MLLKHLNNCSSRWSVCRNPGTTEKHHSLQLLVKLHLFSSLRVLDLENQSDCNCKQLKLVNNMDKQKRRLATNYTNDTDFIRIVHGASALKRRGNDVTRKTGNFLPSIPRSERKGKSDCGCSFCDGTSKSRSWRDSNTQTPSSTTQARQLTPTGFRQFWLRYKSSLAIQSSEFYQDIDAYSIEVIREHNEPRLVLPSLRNKLN